MQYNGKFLNPYDVLGLPWASDFELVKATYRSLVKIYHPDIFKGDKDFAKERLAQLNSAYEFLSDPEQKGEFDKTDQSKNQDDGQQDFDPDRNSNEFDEGINVLKENWDFACGYYPELKELYSDLRKISREPAFVFMAFVYVLLYPIRQWFILNKLIEENNRGLKISIGILLLLTIITIPIFGVYAASVIQPLGLLTPIVVTLFVLPALSKELIKDQYLKFLGKI